jgi:hypothetical protein
MSSPTLTNCHLLSLSLLAFSVGVVGGVRGVENVVVQETAHNPSHVSILSLTRLYYEYIYSATTRLQDCAHKRSNMALRDEYNPRIK